MDPLPPAAADAVQVRKARPRIISWRLAPSVLLLGVLAAAPPGVAGQGEPAPPVPVAEPDAVRLPLEARIDALTDEIAQLRGQLEGSLRPGGAPETGEQSRPASVLDSASELASVDRDQVRNLGLRIVLTLFVLTLMFVVVRSFSWFLEVLAERNAARRLLFKKLIPIIRLILWGVTLYYIVAVIFAVDRAGLLTAFAAIGIAVGFAAQDVLKNIFGGVLIVLDQPFQVGDKIKVGGTYGEVVSIGIRSTRIVTPDDNLVSVPNSQVVESQVANANAGALDCQVTVDLYLPGWTDVARAKAIAWEAAATSRFVYLEKPITIGVADEVRELFLTRIRVRAYVIDTRHEFALASDITESAKAEFLRAGLLQPMPMRGLVAAPEASSAALAGDGA